MRTMTIEIDDAGQLSVNGPIADKALCYSMLELARDAVKDFHDEAAKRAIVAPSSQDMLALRRSPG